MTGARFGMFIVLLTVGTWAGHAQRRDVNYDEEKVPPYTLPDPLVFDDGTKVPDAKAWATKRRAQLMRLFETEVYGRSPGRPQTTTERERSVAVNALSGRAVRKQVSVRLAGSDSAPRMELLIYLPPKTEKPAPAFLGLNFSGNHAIHADPGIALSTSWTRGTAETGVDNNKPTERARGTAASRWPVEMILQRGYALVTAHYGDIDPDFDDGFQNGVHPLFYKPGQTRPAADEWGSIAAWAWGLSRALDYLEKDKAIDARRVALIGHSRLGKAALWAGATDQRFAMVISNNSGAGGAALSKRIFGETVEHLNTSFPHWFCANFKKYNRNEPALPVDQHMLLAAIAPRPLYVASAVEDQWADPKGEFLGALHADPVYRLLGTPGLTVREMPSIDAPVGQTIGYHVRSGGHDVTKYDWEQYLGFADKHFRIRNSESGIRNR